jgi:predicted DNA-binding transcriptional regulator AlpA
MNTESDDTLLRAGDVRKRYGGASDMWIYRRLADDPSFPRPIYISRRRFWRVNELVQWERVKAAGIAA